MYILNLNPTYLAMQTSPLPDAAQFTLEKLCPYMTQSIEIHMFPRPETMPIVSWQLAMQIQECRKDHPELRAFRFHTISADESKKWGFTKIENFEHLPPGRLLLLMANLRRGLGDMMLLLPILRAQAKRLRALGWEGNFSISTSTGFRDLFYQQDFVDEILPEMPTLNDICRFDYVMEYGISLERMKSLIGIIDWNEIELCVGLNPPAAWQSTAARRFPGERPKVFLHWDSFDRQRTLPIDWFESVIREFDGVEFYCSLFGNITSGELFPGGPVNLWPKERGLKDLIVTLKAMDAVVTTNTGIAHVAAALDTPTIVIFNGRLYGWGDYWPRQYRRLYPSIIPIGLEENLRLTPEEIQQQVIEKLSQLIPVRELVPA